MRLAQTSDLFGRKTNNWVRAFRPVAELDALTGRRSIWQTAVRLLTARWRLMPLPVEVRGWTPGSGANFGKIKFLALSALAGFRLLRAASRPPPSQQIFRTRCWTLRFGICRNIAARIFCVSFVVSGVECRVSLRSPRHPTLTLGGLNRTLRGAEPDDSGG